MSVHRIQAGQYTGGLYRAEPPDESLLQQLSAVGSLVAKAQPLVSGVRNTVTRIELPVGNETVAMAVKSFPRESWLRDRYFRTSGAKAHRSFSTAVRLSDHGVGTPVPFAYLERWENNRLVESFYLCRYQEAVSNFRDELNRLYRDDPLCRRIMDLMKTVAYAVADMHDAGVFHRDLGNQNIMIRRIDDDTWGDVQFIDLNRAQLVDQLTVRQRARDISRIDLPSDFLRVFKCMYHRDQHPTQEFVEYEDRFRRRFARHTASRKYRHPVRAMKEKQSAARQSQGAVPRGKELWVWDDRSVQAVSTMQSRERHAYYPARNHFYIAKSMLGSFLPVHQVYRELVKHSFKREVDLTGRIGMAVGTDQPAGRTEYPYLADLGRIPVLLRFYHHAGDEQNQQTLDYAKELKDKGHAVFAALVQDRRAVRSPRSWRAFAEKWVSGLSGLADWVEVGHAVNRVKWGVWDIREYRQLLEPVLEASAGLPAMNICGPSVIDFEYHYLAALLDQVGRGEKLDALSGHLYVDRRGAPENRQGPFSAVEKFALAKAYAAWSPAVKGDRFIVSEVNWPLLDTGHYSPVCSPYVIPDSHTNDPSVDEETYADYMIRYYVLALCSGHVDAVYWWRLVARGFGLIDDAEELWRKRPAYHAMSVFHRLLGHAVFKEKLETDAGIYAFRFAASGRDIVMAWAHPAPVAFEPPFSSGESWSRDGAVMDSQKGAVLGPSPVYYIDVT